MRIETCIYAPIQRCFDLARDVETHISSTSGTGERAVRGVTTGLLTLGDEVTWEATHFGIRQRLTARITEFEPPFRFRDSMVRGVFRRFDHDHIFHESKGVTVMTDVFDYTSRLGLLGALADRLFLTRYVAVFLRRRADVIRRLAERTGS